MEINKEYYSAVGQLFEKEFGRPYEMAFSPGRINLLGEHIDYNDGFVLPAAIQLGIYAAFAPNGTDTCNLIAMNFDSRVSIDLNQIGPANGWHNYVLSVLNQFKLRGKQIPGFDMVFKSDLPIGSGLSSSAALEGSVSFIVNHLSGAGFSAKELALIGQAAEHDYPGVKCGIMDQFANMLGKEGHIVRIDCMTQDTDYLPLELNDYTLLLIYSNVQHALTGGEYNERRQQCNEGLHILQQQTGKTSFRDMSLAELGAAAGQMGEKVYQRCQYVLAEIQRTYLAAEALQLGDITAIGKLMFETHEGLSKLYEVSLHELDWLVDFAKDFDGVVGARLMGGGFGGCTLNLIRKDKVASFTQQALDGYKSKFGIDANAYPVVASDGTRLL